MKNRAICSSLKKMILLMAILSVVMMAISSVMDRTDTFVFGLRHLSNIPSLRSLTAEYILASARETDTRSNPEIVVRSTESYTPYDDFYVAPNWTAFDVRCRDNNTYSKMLSFDYVNRNFVRGEFPEVRLYASSIRLSGSIANSTHNTAMLIYNRVPKSGSTTVLNIIAQLSKLNGFSTFTSGFYASHSMPTAKELEFKNMVAAGPPHGNLHVYNRHMYYINVEQYLRNNATMVPNWFNFIRHPVTRFESDFYYLRSASRWGTRTNRPNEQWFGLTLDKCIETNATECDFSGDKILYRELQLTFFCGNSPECRRIGSRDALAQAMVNVEQGYAFVGTTEQMELGLKVLEAVLPGFFKGVQKVFKGQKNNEGKKRQGMSATSLETLEKHLATEIEFYDFVRQRMEKMARHFGVGPIVDPPIVRDPQPGFPLSNVGMPP